MLNEDYLRDLWGNIKHNNICIIGISEGEEREQRIESLFEEIMTESSLNLVKKKEAQVQEAQNPKQNKPKKVQTKTHHN